MGQALLVYIAYADDVVLLVHYCEGIQDLLMRYCSRQMGRRRPNCEHFEHQMEEKLL